MDISQSKVWGARQPRYIFQMVGTGMYRTVSTVLSEAYMMAVRGGGWSGVALASREGTTSNFRLRRMNAQTIQGLVSKVNLLVVKGCVDIFSPSSAARSSAI
jgi:hypothetical protein